MNDVLMLVDRDWKDSHVADYLKISGFAVTELDVKRLSGFEAQILHKNLVIILCEHAEYYVEMCRKLRSYTEIPIVIVTGSCNEWTKVRMFENGADDYLTEPVGHVALVAQLQARISQYKRLTRLFGYITVRNLVIEVLNRKVYVDGVPVDLSIKEFDVLLYMVQHANEVVTRQELYAAVWKAASDVGVNSSVPTYIKKLRRKIEKDPENPQFLETIWGVGYRFVM